MLASCSVLLVLVRFLFASCPGSILVQFFYDLYNSDLMFLLHKFGWCVIFFVFMKQDFTSDHSETYGFKAGEGFRW